MTTMGTGRMRRLRLATLMAVGTPLITVAAQGPGAPVTTDRTGHRAVEVWAGVSRGSSMWGQLGDMPDETMALTAVRFVERVHRADAVSVEYGVDLIPIALMSPPYRVPDTSCGATCAVSTSDPHAGAAAHGAGFNPISLTAVFRVDRALQLRAGGSAGALWFDRPVPTTTAARLNFTGSLELGAQLIGAQGNGLVVMYRFHHLSNAGRGAENPGIASHLITLGARWRLASTTK